ncbi:carboxypeptidase inhibitor SmCI-like [Glandiceps talaboti]
MVTHFTNVAVKMFSFRHYNVMSVFLHCTLMIVVLFGVFGVTQTAPGSTICTLPKITGPCRAYFPSWYFNTQTAECEQFIYGGCNGNSNRFATEKECNNTCLNSKNDKSEPKPCDLLLGQSTHLIGAYIPQCTDDGYFKPTQCHGSIGGCWCVDKFGNKLGEVYDAHQNCEELVQKKENGP